MLMAHRSRDAAFIARTAGTVVIADMLFTLTAVLLQPLSGGVLMWLFSTAWSEPLDDTSLGLYGRRAVLGARDLHADRNARSRTQGGWKWQNQKLPPRYFALFHRWFLFGIRFWLGHGYSLADDRQTALGKHERRHPKILVLGASGLIGRFVTDDLRAGFPWWASPANCPRRRKAARSISNCLHVDGSGTLARLLRDHRIDVVVNCLGVLQDGPGSDTTAVHCDFGALLQAIRKPATARSGWCISRFPARARPTAPPSAPPNARPSG